MSLQTPFTSIPRCLSMALATWQGASKTTIRVLPEKTTYVDGEQIIFHLPSSGVYDFWNASISAGVSVTTSAASNVTLPQGLAAAISRMELSAGGQTIYGASAPNDWSTAWVYRRLLSQPQYQKGSSRSVYEYPTVSIGSAQTTTIQAHIPEIHALCFKNLRMCPVGAFPQDMQLRLTLDMGKRLALASGQTSYNSVTPVLYLQKYVFPNEFNPELVLARALETGVFQVALEQFVVQQSAPQTNGMINFPIASNSLDYLLYVFKSGGTIDRTNFFDSQYPTSGSLLYDINMVPTSNWSIQNSSEAFLYTLMNLDGGWNSGVDPQITFATYNATVGTAGGARFCFLERFCLPKASIEDASVSGLSTLGSTIPAHLTVSGSSVSLTPVGIGIVTSLVQIAKGRQVAVLM